MHKKLARSTILPLLSPEITEKRVQRVPFTTSDFVSLPSSQTTFLPQLSLSLSSVFILPNLDEFNLWSSRGSSGRHIQPYLAALLLLTNVLTCE
jgi:hypothetical protein